ncbi:MAG: hypothetical protein F6K58_25865 [Symploca sp. SIO2E9]|nr:hypothetical protein [Symploca sp. SIO2E9]
MNWEHVRFADQSFARTSCRFANIRQPLLATLGEGEQAFKVPLPGLPEVFRVRVSEKKSGGTSKQTPRRPDAQTRRIEITTKISLTLRVRTYKGDMLPNEFFL